MLNDYIAFSNNLRTICEPLELIRISSSKCTPWYAICDVLYMCCPQGVVIIKVYKPACQCMCSAQHTLLCWLIHLCYNDSLRPKHVAVDVLYVINGVSWSAFVGWYSVCKNRCLMNNIKFVRVKCLKFCRNEECKYPYKFRGKWYSVWEK